MLFSFLWDTSFWCAISYQREKNLMEQNQLSPSLKRVRRALQFENLSQSLGATHF
jgi:predicted nucleic acid-binding protein